MRKLLPLANHCNVSIITRNETLGQRFESARRLFIFADLQVKLRDATRPQCQGRGYVTATRQIGTLGRMEAGWHTARIDFDGKASWPGVGRGMGALLCLAQGCVGTSGGPSRFFLYRTRRPLPSVQTRAVDGLKRYCYATTLVKLLNLV
jgi:hypothetical protein